MPEFTIDDIKGLLIRDRVRIIENLKKHSRSLNDADLANYLGVSPVGVANARSKKVPAVWPLSVAYFEGIRANHLIGSGFGYDSKEIDSEFPREDIDIDILRQVIEGVEFSLEQKRVTLDSIKKSELIVLLYEHFKHGNSINQDTVERYLRLAS